MTARSVPARRATIAVSAGNGDEQAPRPYPLTLDGGAVLPVHDEPDRLGALLDELDSAIIELDQALAMLGEAQRRAEVARARVALHQAAVQVASTNR